MTTQNNNNNEELSGKDFNRIFSFNNLLNKLLSWSVYILLAGSAIILIYFSFIDKIKIEFDLVTLGIFSLVTVILVWVNWNTFYRKQYEKTMKLDIENYEKKYSIHARYKTIISKWTDEELQLAIDEFNDEYEKKWLNYVERVTGCPIETVYKAEVDENGKEVLDENGKPNIIEVKGIKDLPYKGFRHKILMWRIKRHIYPQSGYKTSMELMSLLSFRENNIHKRNLKASRNFYIGNSLFKLVSFLALISIAGSILPELISGNFVAALARLLIALGSLFSSVMFGAMNGIRGARLKLSTVEDAAFDMELWYKKKHNFVEIEEPIIEQLELPIPEEPKTLNEKATEKLNDIFNFNSQK